MSEELETTEVESVESTTEELSEEMTSIKDEMLKAMTEPEAEDDDKGEVAESAEEAPVVAVEEGSVQEVPEETPLPEWTGEIKIEGDEVVTADGTKIPVDLAQDVINWREGGGKADWMLKPLDEFETEEQKAAYKWAQSSHDKWKNEQKKEEEPSFVTDEAKQWYNERKDNPAYADFFSELDRIAAGDKPKTESAEQKQVEVKNTYEDKQAEIVQQLKDGTIDEADAMGMFAEANKIYKAELEKSMREEARKIASEETRKTIAEERQQAQANKLKSEHAELMQDRGYAEMFDDVGADGLSPIERIAAHGDPITGQYPKTLREAYKMCLQYQRGGTSGSINLRTLSAQPNGMQTNAEENPVSEEEEKMSAREMMLREFQKENK